MAANDPHAITVADVQRAHLRETLHGHGAKGMYLYGYRCVEYPRLTKEIRRQSRSEHEMISYFVDGVKVDGNAGALAKALNRPHDLAGAATRLKVSFFKPELTVALVDGRLVVGGETEARCLKLRDSYPHFEGVPIDWCAAVPGLSATIGQ